MVSFKLTSRTGRKGKNTTDFKLNDIYKYYVSQTGPTSFSKSIFSKLIREFNTEVAEVLLTKPVTLHLPCNAGDLGIKKYRQNFKNKAKLKIDWAASKKIGKIMYHLNEDRDGYKYFFHWEKSKKVPYIKAYNFYPCRTLKRDLNATLKADLSRDFPELPLTKYKKIKVITKTNEQDSNTTGNSQ